MIWIETKVSDIPPAFSMPLEPHLFRIKVFFAISSFLEQLSRTMTEEFMISNL